MYLAACLIIKNEAEYLKEWLDFEHFIIYDNQSQDNIKEVLKEYINKRLITYIYWDNSMVTQNPNFFYKLGDKSLNNPQITAYYHAFNNFVKFKWIAFLDSDEFLFSLKDKDLKHTLKNYEDLPSICVFWKTFGTSKIIKKSSDSVLTRYTLRPNDNFFQNLKFKSIVQPKRTTNVLTAHRFRTDINPVPNTPIIVYDENKKPIVFKRWKELKPSTKILRINHYFTKSKEEYQNKIKRGWFYLDKKEIYFKQVIFDEIDKNNIEDKEIFKILDQ